ncbi:hypothetical protein [Amycolatopsis sp. EV170708-02-1]|uniref:hypothetical protein n=1 Tax=Amycolatopsis sp. EV170708-02-1 TaxID=2919322 RepID=UPI001F0BB515|nr:hypothetical protein [Amycolatopsis sp. EV170708-02-1]UMP03518.1 hypothetical protein MJQ72_01125 [Amycolatopsis sp. EV170708-02-1]
MRWIAACLLLLLAGCDLGTGRPRLESFVELGSARPPAGSKAVELGTAGGQEFQRTLERAKISNPDKVRAALSFTPTADRRAFAFVKPGCAEDGAELTIERDTLKVELTGGENVNCGTANYFLTVFSVDRDSIPATPTLR